VTAAGFDGRARLASGSTPAALVTYRVTLAAGALRLGPSDTSGVVLDVPVARVRGRPLGRAGSVVLEVDAAPLLVNFSDHGSRSEGAGARVGRLLDAGRGRFHRRRFLRALARERL
jgi:hypothetical protein